MCFAEFQIDPAYKRNLDTRFMDLLKDFNTQFSYPCNTVADISASTLREIPAEDSKEGVTTILFGCSFAARIRFLLFFCVYHHCDVSLDWVQQKLFILIKCFYYFMVNVHYIGQVTLDDSSSELK